MKSPNTLFCLITLLFIASCGVPQSDYDNLQSRHDRLEAELEECQSGAEKLIAGIERAYTEKEYDLAKEKIELLYEKHPESPKNEEFQQLLKEIEKEKEKQRRLENFENTGMWKVSYYVDEFGEPTKEGYVTNSRYIIGKFSNTATQNSDLTVRFLATSESDISIKLFEYASNNPVKSYSYDVYRVSVQDKDGNRLKLRAENSSDRLSFGRKDSRKLHNVLMKGGTVKFKIIESDTPTTQYEFTLTNADWYENAYRMLKESGT